MAATDWSSILQASTTSGPIDPPNNGLLAFPGHFALVSSTQNSITANLIFDGSISLDYGSMTGVEVQAATDVAFTNQVTVSNPPNIHSSLNSLAGTTVPITFGGLQPSTTYYFRIRGFEDG